MTDPNNLPKDPSRFSSDDFYEVNACRGKTWVSFGDSITYHNLWQPYILARAAMTHYNCGVPGAPLAGDSEIAYWQTARLNAVKSYEPDMITILGGANDCYLNIPVGTEKNLIDRDTDSFIGAYSYIIDNLLTWKPCLRIIILSTTYAHENGMGCNHTYDDYASACKKVAEYYHLPYVDLYGQSGFNHYTMGDAPNDVYSDDHVHPNDAGARIIASMVWEKLREVFLFSQ